MDSELPLNPDELYKVKGAILIEYRDLKRKYANPDIDAAVEITGQLRFAKTADDWDDMIYDVTKEAVDAALGIRRTDET